MEATANGPKGIGGWLILPTLGLIITPFRMAFQFYQDIIPAFSPEAWGILTNPSSAAYHPLFGPLIIFELIANVAMFVFSLWLLWIFFNKSNRVPKIFIGWLVVSVVIQFIDHALSHQIPAIAAQPVDPESLKELSRSILGAAIWIPYFLKSERVKNTFTEPAT